MKALVHVLVLALALTSFGAQAKGGCRQIEKACKAAHKKKHKDCLNKILAGEVVEGVTAEQADVEACKAKKHK